MLAKDGTTIYYFGGTASPRLVQKFDSINNSTMPLPTALPSQVRYSGGVSMSGTIFLFDGYQRTVMEFSEETETASIIADLPFKNDTSAIGFTSAIPHGADGVWLFAGNGKKPTNPILLFNTTTKDVKILSENTTSLPTFYDVPASVSDGHYGYLIGGLGKAKESDGSTHLSNGILKYFRTINIFQILSII
jgi:hypothetical protein